VLFRLLHFLAPGFLIYRMDFVARGVLGNEFKFKYTQA